MNLPAGSYEVVIQARLGETRWRAKTYVRGRPAEPEYEKLDLDDKLLAEIAAETGGRYVHMTTAKTIALDRTRNQRVYLNALFSPPLFWLIFVAAITTEWICEESFNCDDLKDRISLPGTGRLARVKNLSLVARAWSRARLPACTPARTKVYVEFAEHRSIRWATIPAISTTSCPHGAAVIKQYEEETNMRVQILLDVSGSMAYRYETKIRNTTTGLSVGDSRLPDDPAARLVGLTTFDTQIQLDMPRSSPRHFNEMMRQLEAIEPGGGDGHFRRAPQAGQPVQETLPDRAHQRPLRSGK